MGTLIVDTIGGRNDNAPNQSDGLTVTGVCSATDFSGLVGGAADFPNGLTATTVTTTGNVSVGGTLTYDDVTNIDSVGIVTAGKGFRATTGGLHVVAGVSTFSEDVIFTGASYNVTWDKSADDLIFNDNAKAAFGSGSDMAIYHTGTHGYISNDTGDLILGAGNGTSIKLQPEGGEDGLTVNQNGSVDLYYDNTKRIETISTGASVYGALKLQNGLLRENVNRNTSAAANAATALDLDNGMVHWFTTNLGAANVKMNVVSGAGINTDMAIGDMISVTIMTKVNSTSNFIEQVRVDGVEASAGVTTYWAGGSAPTDGGGTGVDTYAFNILKTGNATYDMIGNQVKGS
jgi:hypothetical protein